MFNSVFLTCRLLHNAEKYCRAGQATDDKMAHAHCMLDNYMHTLGVCNTYCCSTATMVARTRLNITLQYTGCLVYINHDSYITSLIKSNKKTA
jgi:hypothetical protein